MLLADAPAFSRVMITALGSIQEIDTDPPAIGDKVILWSHCETNSDNPFAVNRIRGIIHSNRGLIWIPENAEVKVVRPPRYAGKPEDLIRQARPVKAPAGSKGVVKTADGWPPLIWQSDLVFSPVQGWDDAETAVEVLMCALAVAPNDDPDLKPMLLAALTARYARLVKDPKTYPPNQYPWRNRSTPGPTMLKYLVG